MNTVTLTDRTLLVEPRGLDKLWSFTRRLEVPLEHVRGATVDTGAVRDRKGVRRPGLGLPGKWAGTWSLDGELAFWNVRGYGDVVVVELAEERFARLVLTVADPRATVDAVNAVTPA